MAVINVPVYAARVAELEAQVNDLRTRLRLSEASPDLSSEAIMLCRQLLDEHLGIRAAFFDDCVMLAIRRVLRAEDALQAVLHAASVSEAPRQHAVEKARAVLAERPPPATREP